MDELIILLVRGLIKLLGGDASKRPVRSIGAPWEPPAPAAAPAKTTAMGNAFSARPVKRRPGGRRPPPPIPVAAPIVTSTQAPPHTAPAPATAKAREMSGVNAVALHRWLTPQTLRRQFILTEVLQPPLALRNSDSQLHD
jgi:hypothetical protein